MKTILLIIFSFVILISFSQTEVEIIVNKGIQYHDGGDYDKAIETYKKALAIDSKSTLVNYEIALTYFKKGDYKNALVFAENVIKQKSDNLVASYVVAGSSLDMMG